MKLRQAMIFAKDMERMTAFYRDGLGLREIIESRQDGWVEFDAGGALLALHAIPAHIAQGIRIESPPDAREDTAIKLVFEAPDVAAARAHLISHGAIMFEPRAWGGCDGLDPEGNVFQVVAKKK
jgi:catechol 2,3-dioxygenase-like lactoylglutathione lyase family enzyme